MMKTAKDVLKAIKDNDVKYVDLASPIHAANGSSDLRSDADRRDAFAEGLMFDGSSIAAESDQRVRHDAYARSGLGVHGPVLRRLDDGHQLRHSRSRQRPAV